MAIPLIDPAVVARLHTQYPPQPQVPMAVAPANPIPGPAVAAAAAAPIGITGFNFKVAIATPRSPVKIYDASQNPAHLLQGRGVFSVLAPERTLHANTCFQSLSTADRFSRTVLKKHPVNSDTKTIAAYLHSADRDAQDNAFWSADRQGIIFGEYNPLIFNRMDLNPDIIQHELGHAVVDYAGGLTYWGESGALNESMADIFAISIKHQQRQSRANDPNTSWLIGEGLIPGDSLKHALRSMDDPGNAHKIMIAGDPIPLMQDSQVGHMNDFRHGPQDSGGVHSNSGIPSRAFVLAAQGNQGIVHKHIGLVWFKALELSNNNPSFAQFARHTITSAEQLFPKNGNITNIVGQAWAQVGVHPAPL